MIHDIERSKTQPGDIILYNDWFYMRVLSVAPDGRLFCKYRGRTISIPPEKLGRVTVEITGTVCGMALVPVKGQSHGR